MHESEALWLQQRFSEMPVEVLSPLLNIGSSTTFFRTQVQPHVDALVFRPLELRGVRPVHFDLKMGEGVDVSGDIFNDDDFHKLKSFAPRAILCSNVLEHVTEPGKLAQRCLELLPPGGLLFITVPYSYPYHADPIDTLYRPSPEEVGRLFAPHQVVSQEVVNAGSYRDVLKKQPLKIFRHIFRFPFPFIAFKKWQRSMKKLYWLIHPYQVTCVVIRKNQES